MKDDDTNINNIPSIIAGIMLLLAILPIWPYGYYQILRLVVTGTAVYNVYVMYKVQKKIWVSIMIAIVVLFNPIVPIYLTKSIWTFLNLIAATLMFTFSTISNKE